MIDTSVKDSFLDLFYHDIEDMKLDKSNSLNVFTLKVRNNKFAYDDLVELLSNQLYHFALSRTEVKKLKETEQFGSLVSKAKSKFRNYVSNEGELGEVLLYCLLEAHLNAPKILSKLEIKTAHNDYVKGADGVHLLKINDSNYQLILGESKLNSDLSKGIYESFNSISTLLSEEGKLDFEVGLVNSQLVKEAFDEVLYTHLKKVIMPSAREDETNLDYSFGIFLGFDIEISEVESDQTNPEFRTYIRGKIKSHIEERISKINYQINKSQFIGYNFNIYIIPFSDLEMKRKELLQQLM